MKRLLILSWLVFVTTDVSSGAALLLHEELPVSSGDAVTVVATSGTFSGTVIRSRSDAWLGLSTDSGTVFLPLSTVTQIWPEEEGRAARPVPDPAFRRALVADGPVELERVAAIDDSAGNIYERLWKLDQQHNGLTVSARKNATEWVKPDADILLDEQAKFTGGLDRAPKPLFAKVDLTKVSGPTYVTAKALFDNYVAKDREPEDALGSNVTEDAEIDAFIDAILQTDVMKLCQQDIEDRILGVPFDDGEFAVAIRKQWFELYHNFYRADCDDSVPGKKFSNGFEHVFVGDYETGGIGGHHFWYKFFLEEQNGDANTLGWNYGQNSGGQTYPWVATFAMKWKIDGATKSSGKKGFLVGNSPELLIAWGTTAYYEAEKGLRSGDHIPIVIEGAKLDLVVYLETLADCSDGDHIKSQFPKFISLDGSTPGGEPGGIVMQNGPITITQAMINPSGDEVGREWVDIKHVGDDSDGAVSLAGWMLCDKHGRCQTITGLLAPGEFMRVVCTRETADHPQLANSGGLITLMTDNGITASRAKYSSSSNGVVNVFTASP